MNLDDLIPFGDKHSIKEAVVSFFLVNPIVKPEEFGNLKKEGKEFRFPKVWDCATTRALDTDIGNPFHSDILYSHALTDDAEPKTEIRMLAEEIRKRAIYFEDKSSSDVWEGDNLDAFK